MVSPSFEDRICEMFDSFCKTVSRNYYRDLLRAENRRNSHYKEEPVDYAVQVRHTPSVRTADQGAVP